MSDYSGDDLEHDLQGLAPPTKRKRQNHNELERKRRQHQRDVLYQLRDMIPSLTLIKPSSVLIMQKAQEYIRVLESSVATVEMENNGLRQHLAQLTNQIIPPRPSILSDLSNGYGPVRPPMIKPPEVAAKDYASLEESKDPLLARQPIAPRPEGLDSEDVKPRFLYYPTSTDVDVASHHVATTPRGPHHTLSPISPNHPAPMAPATHSIPLRPLNDQTTANELYPLESQETVLSSPPAASAPPAAAIAHIETMPPPPIPPTDPSSTSHAPAAAPMAATTAPGPGTTNADSRVEPRPDQPEASEPLGLAPSWQQDATAVKQENHRLQQRIQDLERRLADRTFGSNSQQYFADVANDSAALFRKRKSLADNEYEALQQGLFDRRNSQLATWEMMKQQSEGSRTDQQSGNQESFYHLKKNSLPSSRLAGMLPSSIPEEPGVKLEGLHFSSSTDDV
ncbi:hypothetical protein H4R34_000359 [Dimargaris verticillata]|uniref:BHLH domain-containing protein n=1 Tax=Dimargaris verticillata TaxID=2761393 RepID=A0A9W8EG01_9FUNG|nr:hypothetical protein H4R34_000359 [Dimargaris verticillata]